MNHACPTGATRGARCHGLFHGAKSSVPCGTRGLKFPSYDETCGLFMATVLALLTLVYAISARRRRSPSGVKQRGVAARLAASDDAATASARRAFGLTGDDDFPPWYGLEFDGHALCGNQPLVSGVPTKLQKSLPRSNRSRCG